MTVDESTERAPEPLESFVVDALDKLLADGVDEHYLAALKRLYSRPATSGALTELEQALIVLATQVLVTQLDEDGIRRSVDAARRLGASDEELTTTVQLASVIGLHSISWGVPRLRSILEARGEWPNTDDDPRVQRIVQHGYRGTPVVGMLRSIAELDPEYFEAFREALEIPWASPALTPRMKQLICIAIDACASHLYADGFDLHVRQALDAGATPADIFEVLQLCSVTGLRSTAIAMPHLGARTGA